MRHGNLEKHGIMVESGYVESCRDCGMASNCVPADAAVAPAVRSAVLLVSFKLSNITRGMRFNLDICSHTILCFSACFLVLRSRTVSDALCSRACDRWYGCDCDPHRISSPACMHRLDSPVLAVVLSNCSESACSALKLAMPYANSRWPTCGNSR